MLPDSTAEPTVGDVAATLGLLVGRCERLLDRCDDLARGGAELIEIAEVRRYLKGEQ